MKISILHIKNFLLYVNNYIPYENNCVHHIKMIDIFIRLCIRVTHISDSNG